MISSSRWAGILLMGFCAAWCAEGAAAEMAPSGNERMTPTLLKRLIQRDAAKRHQVITAAIREPTPVVDGGLEFPLPAEPNEALPAFDGLYVAIKYRELKRIDLLSMHDGRRVLTIPLAEADAVYGCGGDRLFVASPEARVLETWDLTKLEKIETQRFDVGGTLTHLTVASGRSDVAFARWWTDIGGTQPCRAGLFDLNQARLISEPRQLDVLDTDRVVLELRTDAELSSIAVYMISGYLPQRHTHLWFEDGQLQQQARGEAFAYRPRLGLSNAFHPPTRRGRPISYDPKEVTGEGFGNECFPVIDDGAYLIAIKSYQKTSREAPNRVRVFWSGQDEPINEFDYERPLIDITTNQSEQTHLSNDRAVLAVAAVDRLAIINPKRHVMSLFALGINPRPRAPLIEARTVFRGGRWTAALPANAGEVQIIDAPPGTAVDAEAGRVVWEIPADHDPGIYPISYRVQLDGGEAQTFQAFVKVTPRYSDDQ